jgi:hypothetical protein
VGSNLEQLEGEKWGAPEFDSHLVTTCHALRQKPISEFTVEDLRIMIGQNIGLPHLMPIAIDVLNKESLAEGDYFPGDLLANVVRADPEFFASNAAIANQLAAICERALSQLSEENHENDLRPYCAQFLKDRAVT